METNLGNRATAKAAMVKMHMDPVKAAADTKAEVLKVAATRVVDTKVANTKAVDTRVAAFKVAATRAVDTKVADTRVAAIKAVATRAVDTKVAAIKAVAIKVAGIKAVGTLNADIRAAGIKAVASTALTGVTAAIMRAPAAVRPKADLHGCAVIPVPAAIIISNRGNRIPDAALKIINALTNASAKTYVTACQTIINLTRQTSTCRYRVARLHFPVR